METHLRKRKSRYTPLNILYPNLDQHKALTGCDLLQIGTTHDIFGWHCGTKATLFAARKGMGPAASGTQRGRPPPVSTPRSVKT